MDDGTIRAFLREDYARVVAAVTLVSGSRASAEDAVQEALVRAWTSSQRGQSIESLPAWVVTVALNLSRSAVRRAIAERRAAHRVGVRDTSVAEPSGDPTDVQRALADLPRRQREVAVLRYVMDLNTEETARALAIGEGTVKSTLAKARAKLGAALAEDDRDEASDRAEP